MYVRNADVYCSLRKAIWCESGIWSGYIPVPGHVSGSCRLNLFFIIIIII